METNWTPEIVKRLEELATQRRIFGEPNATEMVEILKTEFGVSFTKDAVNNKIRREGLGQSAPDDPVLMPYYAKYEQQIKSCPSKPSGVDLSGKKKILHLCDLHIPYHDLKAVSLAVNMAAAADIVVISELMDVESQSSFITFKPASLEQEIESTLAMLEFFSEKFPKIFLIVSNHDLRIQRKFAKLLPRDLQMLIDDVNLVELLSRPFHNVEVINNWWFKLGDIIFAHASYSTQVVLKAVSDLDAYFLNLGLQYRVLVQAHTHSLGVVYKQNRKLIEAGMLCKPLAYYQSKPSKLSWCQGFVVLELQDGHAILDRCREYHVPLAETRIETEIKQEQDA